MFFLIIKKVMGDFNKHIALAKEKLNALNSAYSKKQNTVVGDLGTKVVEQLIEADTARKNEHFGDHRSRHDYANRQFPKRVNIAMRKIWFAYGDLGYDGINGKRARTVMDNMIILIKFFETRFEVEINEQSS